MTADEAAARIGLTPAWAEGDFSATLRLLADDAVMSAYMPEGVALFGGLDFDAKEVGAAGDGVWVKLASRAASPG